MSQNKKYVVVISDCHLSGGRYVQGRHNPHEDFHFDREMIDFLKFFSTGRFVDGGDSGGVNLDLVINGDFLDFLNVPYQGEFEEGITEEIALAKLEEIIRAHREVMDALRSFAAVPGRRILYLIGNHDAELFFPAVRARITSLWDPDGLTVSDRVQVIADQDRIRYVEGLEIRHGNQFEASNQLDFERPMVKLNNGALVLNIPWGSIYVLKIINRLKWERSNLDKIRPLKVYAFFGLILDPLFTFRFLALSLFYFLRTRVFSQTKGLLGLRQTLKILGQEGNFFLNLEKEARQVLSEDPSLKTVVFGHTHLPMHRIYPNGQEYLNSGTWTRMVYLDWRYLSEPFRKTFVLADLSGGQVKAELHQWYRNHRPFSHFLET